MNAQDSNLPQVVVTGGAGYIGSHVCKMLHENGFLPVTFDNLSRGNAWAVKWGPLEQVDICDKDHLRSVFERYKPIAVMHFAAYAYVGESVSNPGIYYANNVLGSLNLLDILNEIGVRVFVFSSTCSTYGEPLSHSIDESHPQNPINPYGASKLMVERILRDFETAHDVRSVSLRYFNAAGADPESLIGEAHDPETHILPLILDVATGLRPCFDIFGNDYSTPDGTCIRDFIHVTDLAKAHVLSLKYLLNGGSTSALNLGNSLGYSVKEIISAVEHVTGSRVKVRVVSRRPGDPARLVANYQKAQRVIDWNPIYTKIEQIIETAWQWHKKYRAGIEGR